MTASQVCVASGLRKCYGDLVAADDVSFHIDAGEVYGLLGPNGAGKTTSISMVVGLVERDGGTVSICGEDIDAGARTRRHIGYVPQEIALYRDLTGDENLRFWGRMYGLSGSQLADRIDVVLAVTGLTERAKDRVKEYSGGMQRRLNIAVGLLHQPQLLVLDEPTVGVDPQSRNSILDAVGTLGAEGLAVLYTTHYMEEAERLCSRVGIMDEGAMVAEGTRRELIALTGEEDRIVLGFAPGTDLAAAARLVEIAPGVDKATSGPETVTVTAPDARAVLPDVVAHVARGGLHLGTVDVHEPDLETTFLHLTGKALRD